MTTNPRVKAQKARERAGLVQVRIGKHPTVLVTTRDADRLHKLAKNVEKQLSEEV